MNQRRRTVSFSLGTALVASLLVPWFTQAVVGAEAPPPSKPVVQIFEEMIKHLRMVETAADKELASPTTQWQAHIDSLTDPLLHSVNDLYRVTSHGGSTTSAYGLRMMLNNLRATHDPKQTREAAGQLIDAVSFLRSEFQLAARKQVAPATAASRTQARELAAEILRRPEFKQSVKPHFFDYYLNRFIVKGIAWLQGIFDSEGMRQTGNFAYLFLWMIYGVVGCLIAWVIYRAWTPRRGASDTAVVENSGIALRNPETHRQEAERLSQQGHFAAAVREYFLMMLSTLEQRNFVARNRSWTNWEYLRAFGSRVRDEATRGRMGQLNRVYDQVSYGGLNCDESRFATFRKSVDDFLSSLPNSQA